MTARLHIFRYFAIIFLVFPMTACSAVNEWLGKFGFDTNDYMSESVTDVCETDGEEAQVITDMLEILTAVSPNLQEFNKMQEAIPLYRDAVLTYMLETEYARYSGNQTLIEEASREYPEYQITQIIPAKDFEATMYQYFGGNVRISHKDGQVFRYLKKVNAYISPVTPVNNECGITITAIEETANTYRVNFTVFADAETSRDYFALVIKREDGTHYFKQITLSTAETESLAG